MAEAEAAPDGAALEGPRRTKGISPTNTTKKRPIPTSENCGPGSTAFRFANTVWNIVATGPTNIIDWESDGLSFVVSERVKGIGCVS